MEYLEYLNEDQYSLQRPARQILVDRSNPLNQFDEITFRDRFCMYKEDVLEIITLLEPRLSSMSRRGRPVPSSLQVLITLRLLASGTFHRETGDLCGVSEATDGCHVEIKCPSTPDAEEYRNHKNWFSINVQAVCTPNLEFSNIVATHNSRIFHNSSLCA